LDKIEIITKILVLSKGINIYNTFYNTPILYNGKGFPYRTFYKNFIGLDGFFSSAREGELKNLHQADEMGGGKKGRGISE